MTHPLETYLTELRDIRSTGAGVKEVSYYPALKQLLDEIGKTLKPKVRAVMNLKNQGADFPDGGLFEASQFQRGEGEPLEGQMPARGCIEVKGTGDEIEAIAASKQVGKYLRKYRQVLVTNLRDFVLVGYDQNEKPVVLESYKLAANEKEFWTKAAHPQAFAKEHGERFAEYLRRVMLHAAELVDPAQVAWFLASYARDARARIEGVDLPALANVRAALEEALGLKFEGVKGEHFFRSTLVQTLFYGIFSAWVLWSKQHAHERAARFDWRNAVWSLHVPMIGALFEQLTLRSNVQQMGIKEVLDWTEAVLSRVNRAEFFARFEEGHAVQYFYEPFLQNFDPELRKQLGVWYTPQEIVKYMVARVDTVLREELNIADGLADERVYVLDPCCGTGAYLVEVLRHIGETLSAKGDDGLAAYDLKRAARERVFGFEILPAPFVVAHLQLGLLLQTMGAPLSEETEERVGVYLTNALTGWEPPKGAKKRLLFPEMEEERDRAEEVKRDKPILVVLGNPPYNAFAGTSPEEEEGLIEPYKEGLKDWGITKNFLDDLYVRFFRLAERRIAERTGKGVVCYISNHSWVSDPSFVVLRQHLLKSFDKFWIENMHGNRKISEYAPDGRTSETVFAIPGISVGIQQGVTISLWLKTETHSEQQILFRDDLNAARATERREQLLNSLEVEDFNAQYEIAKPKKSNRFSFRPSAVNKDYDSWAHIPSLSAINPLLGLNDNRGQATHDITRQVILDRMRAYYDPSVSFEEIKSLHAGLATDAASFDAKATRKRLLKESQYDEQKVRRFWFKPFDLRWAYIERIGNLWNRTRPELLEQAWQGNSFLLARSNAPKAPDGGTFYFSKEISDQHVLHTDAYFIPLLLRTSSNKKKNENQDSFFSEVDLSITANLSLAARAYLASLGIADPDADADTAALVWMHALAIGYAPAYLSENADGIRNDFPRIPLPATREALEASAALGRGVAALLDTEQGVAGVTTGKLDEFTRTVANITRADGKPLDPNAGDLEVTAGWGHGGKGGVTMPGKGKTVERAYTDAERDAITQTAARLSLTPDEALARLGETTRDVYLNGVAYWRNVPARVWDYHIGGYQVIKKWLSYRERELLKRALTADEAREVRDTARRIAALLLLEPALDENYHRVKSATYTWTPA